MNSDADYENDLVNLQDRFIYKSDYRMHLKDRAYRPYRTVRYYNKRKVGPDGKVYYVRCKGTKVSYDVIAGNPRYMFKRNFGPNKWFFK